MSEKRNSSLLGKITVVFVICCCSLSAHAKYGGGTGEPNDPYLIFDDNQLNAIGADSNDWDKHFKLMADIDLSEYSGAAFNIIGYYVAWNDNKPFTGVFDGNGHKISNFTYDSNGENNIGLFVYVKGEQAEIRDLVLDSPNLDAGTGSVVGSVIARLDGCTIRNCAVEDANVFGDDCIGGVVGSRWLGTISDCHFKGSVSGENYIGGLIGNNLEGTVTNCTCSGNVFGIENVGGLVGENEGDISNCSFAGSVSGDSVVGGLVGEAYPSDLTEFSNCSCVGSVSGNRNVGGLVGTNLYNDISTCFFEGNVEGTELSVGGLIGSFSDGRISTSYAKGRVEGTADRVGGLAGATGRRGYVFNSYSSTSVSGNNQIGGLIGFLSDGSGTSNCYANGSVEGTGIFVGGLVGENEGWVLEGFWDVNNAGVYTSAGGIGKSTDEMQTISTFGAWGCDPVWTIDDGNDYPRLWWENIPGEPIIPSFGGGSGEPNDPYLIYTAEQLNTIGVVLCHLDKHFKLMADIDLSGYAGTTFNIIGYQDSSTNNKPFTGVFDGNGKRISGFTYSDTERDNIGLFGIVDGENAQIKRVILEDPNIEGSEYVGALAGYLGKGTIIECQVNGGKVIGYRCVGGLIGLNYEGTVCECRANIDVESDGHNIGGLIGANTSIVKNSSVSGGTAKVQGGFALNIGGLVGYNSGEIDDSYATCSVLGYTYVGGLVGDNSSNGKIQNSYAMGAVTGISEIGGLVGENAGLIFGCHATGNITGWWYVVGGLVGKAFGGDVYNSYATGDITGGDRAGGLIGVNVGRVCNCSASGTVSGEGSVGGLVGINDPGTVSNCFSIGDCLGDGAVGGLVGYNKGPSFIGDCYALGNVSGDNAVGGLVGVADNDTQDISEIENCYSAGSISSGGDIGGLIAVSYSYTIRNCFWDVNLADVNTSAGGIGKTTIEMQEPNTFMDVGWDFILEGENGPSDLWAMPVGGGYPILCRQLDELPQLPSFSGGSGTYDDPYLISTAGELNSIGYNPRLMYCHFELTNTIELSGINFWMIGSWGQIFIGSFDGNGFSLMNLALNEPDAKYVGLFRAVGDGACIEDMGLVNFDVTGYEYVGALAGYNISDGIADCYSSGRIFGHSYVGGLIGYNFGDLGGLFSTANVYCDNRYGGGLFGASGGTIEKCFASGSVSDGNALGGLIGWGMGGTYDSIRQSFALGNVSGGNSVGGLLGSVNGYGISNSYARGNVVGDDRVGGLIGYGGSSRLEKIYATGHVTGTGLYVGGIAGRRGNYGPRDTCFFNKDTSGQIYACGNNECYNVRGLTNAEMQTAGPFTAVGWDFVGETANGTDDIWTINEGHDYPKHVWGLVNLFGFDGVNFKDYSIFSDYWMKTNCGASNDCDGTDFDFSGNVDYKDLKVLLDQWLE
ncbi:MAG: GLUG motif-containing protein [Planctomycetota bacterium]|jgi:hypothetical protein